MTVSPTAVARLVAELGDVELILLGRCANRLALDSGYAARLDRAQDEVLRARGSQDFEERLDAHLAALRSRFPTPLEGWSVSRWPAALEEVAVVIVYAESLELLTDAPYLELDADVLLPLVQPFQDLATVCTLQREEPACFEVLSRLMVEMPYEPVTSLAATARELLIRVS